MPEDTHPSIHPPLPPTTEDDRVSWLRLLRSRRVGPSTFYRLMTEHGTAEAALQALPEVARASGAQNYAPCPAATAEAELQAARRAGATMICIGEPGYPGALAEIPDAPPLIWAVGNTAVLHRPAIAIVGARNASSLGTRMARALARELAEAGFVIVSGLARGVDAAAHIATKDTGTVAVMAGGVDVLYPTENARLGEDLTDAGLRLSESPMGMTPQARHFPTRNRIISGLARALVVVEAAAKSGSLITARAALDQGREVLAVPGHPFDARAAGCNMLIRDGAILVRGAADVIEALPTLDAPASARAAQPDLPFSNAPRPAWQTQKAKASQPRTLQETAELHQKILERLAPTPLAEDQLIRDLAAPVAMVVPMLTTLEIEGRIARHPGGLLSLAGKMSTA